MSALSIQPTYPIFTDTTGQPLENGYIWIGTTNLNPVTNPITVYWDAALTIPAAQPIRTLAGYPANSGTPARLYVNSDYSIRVMNKNGSTVYSAPAATERYSDSVISTINASQVVYDPAGTGAVPTTVETKLQEFISVEDFGVSTTNTPALNSTYAQAAIDAAKAAGKTVLVNGFYEIDAPLVLTGNSGGYTSGGISIIGNAGSIKCGFRKHTHTTYAGVDCIVYIAVPIGASYTSDIVISNLWFEGDIAGDQRTNMVAYGIYSDPSKDVSTLLIENCSVSAETCIRLEKAFLWTVRRVGMWPKNTGLYHRTGTSGRVEECFVQSPLQYGYYLGGSYSSMSSCAVDGCEGISYFFIGASWHVGGLGSESTLATAVVDIYESEVIISGGRVHHPSGDASVMFMVEANSKLQVSGISIGNFTGNTTPAGYLFNMTTNATLTLEDITLSAKPFKYNFSGNSSTTIKLRNIGSQYGEVSWRNHMYPIAGLTYGFIDTYLGPSASVKGASVWVGGSDTSPDIDGTIRFDDGIPVNSIVLNTRGSDQYTQGWVCTSTAATIAASTFRKITLVNYDQNTWTTTVAATANITGTPTLSKAEYTRIGRMITLTGEWAATITAPATRVDLAFNLPIVSGSNAFAAAGTAVMEDGTGVVAIGGVIDPSAANPNTAAIYVPPIGVPAGAVAIKFSLSYFV